MKTPTYLFLAMALTAPVAYAQRIKLEVPESVSARAAETVDVTLDGAMLRLAGKFLSETDTDERAVKSMVGKLEGIYVKSYRFDDAGEYDRDIIEKVRAQLGPTRATTSRFSSTCGESRSPDW